MAADQSTAPGGTVPDDLLPSREARRNQALAYQAIRYVRERVAHRNLGQPEPRYVHVTHDRFPQWLLGRFEQVWSIGHEWERQRKLADWTTNALVHRLARAAEQSGTGESGGQAALAFSYLHSLGYRPIDFMHTPGREHAFLVLGRRLVEEAAAERKKKDDEAVDPDVEKLQQAAQELRPESWGKAAVVCDPYRGVAYGQLELINTEYYFDYYPCEAQLRAPLVPGAAMDF